MDTHTPPTTILHRGLTLSLYSIDPLQIDGWDWFTYVLNGDTHRLWEHCPELDFIVQTQ